MKNKDMRIGLVFPYDISLSGGVKELVLLIYKYLKEEGIYVKILTPTPKNFEGEPDVDVILIGSGANLRTPYATTGQVGAVILSEKMRRILLDEQFDIIHFHEPWVPILSKQILRESEALHVATFHTKLPESVMLKTLEKVVMPYLRSFIKDIDRFVAVSDAAADFFRNVADEPIEIIPNAIDIKKFSNPNPPKTNKQKILYVGRLEKRKGVKYLLESFAELKKILPKASLDIIGDGEEREKLEEQVVEHGLRDVVFHGQVSDKVKIEMIHNSDLFVSPALYGESFGIVLIEAMAAGVPVVAGDNVGYRGVMKGLGRIGLCDPKDTEDFVEKMKLLLTDVATRKLWTKWALEEVKKYDYKVVLEQYLDLYHDMLKGKNRS